MRRSTAIRAGVFALGGALVVVSGWLARRGEPGAVETRVFRAVNGASLRLQWPVRTLMQAGTFGAVPTIAVVCWLAGRRALAVRVLGAGTTAWLLAKGAKPMVGRPRPAELMEDVRVLGNVGGDLGWTSGHAAVSTALAMVLWPEVPTWARTPLAAMPVVVGFGRMYVGAHLPLDLAGGAGLGLMVGAVGSSLARGRRHLA